jgi:hypothetical protein
MRSVGLSGLSQMCLNIYSTLTLDYRDLVAPLFKNLIERPLSRRTTVFSLMRRERRVLDATMGRGDVVPRLERGRYGSG